MEKIALNQKVYVWYTEYLGMEREIPACFSWHHFPVEWEFPFYCRDISTMESMSTWLEILIKMSLVKCYISMNKKHNESLPSIPIMCAFLSNI